MARRTVIEELVVVLTGDATSYGRMVSQINTLNQRVVSSINTAFNSVRNVVNSAAARTIVPIRNMMNQVATSTRAMANQVRANLGGMIGSIGASFGAMATNIRTRANSLGAYLTSGAFGRALHNFRLGAAAGFSAHLPGFYPGFTRRFGTMSARMGLRVGALGSAGLMAAQGLYSGARGVGGSIRRGAQNFGMGAYRGFMGAGRPLITMAGRTGHFLGTGARVVGGAVVSGARMAGSALSAGGAALASGAGAVGRGAMAGAGFAGRSIRNVAGGLAGGGAAMTAGMISGFRNLQSAASTAFGSIGIQLRRMGYDMQYIGRRMSFYLSIPLMGIGIAATRAFSKFDDAMTTSLALMGKVSPAMRKQMEKTVFDISAKSRTAPTDVALGYYHLASAGYKAADAMKVVGVVEQFAVAGAFDLNESGHSAGNSLYAMGKATNYLVDIQAALGKRVGDTAKNMENMTHVADVLTKANQIANGTVDDFAKSLTSKGAAAIRMLNKDMEEGVAVLAAYAAQGVKGESAGEKLYILSRDLQRSVLKNTQAWRQFGLSVYDSNGKMLNFADILGQLEKVLGPMSDEQKRATLMQLGFQDRSLAATIQILGMSNAIRNYEEQLRMAGGTIKEVSEARLKSFASQMAILRNQITIVGIGIGEMLVPYLMRMNDALKAGIANWRAMTEPFQKWAIALGAVGAAVGPVLVFIGTVTTGLGTLNRLWLYGGRTVLWFGSLFLNWPVLIGAAIAAVIAYFIGPKGLLAAYETVKKGLSSFVVYAVGFLEHFSENMRILLDWLKLNWKNVFIDMFNATITIFQNMVHNIKEVLVTMMETFGVFFGWMVAKFQHVFSDEFMHWAWEGMKKVGFAILEWAGAVADTIEAIFTPSNWASAFKNAQDFFTKAAVKGVEAPSLASAISDVWGKGFGKMKNPLAGFKSSITAAPKFITDLPKPAEAAAEAVADVADAVAQVSDEIENGNFRVEFEVGGVEALRAGSAKAIHALADFRRANYGGVGGAGGGVAAAMGAGVRGVGGNPIAAAGGAGVPDGAFKAKALEMKSSRVSKMKALKDARAKLHGKYNERYAKARDHVFSGTAATDEGVVATAGQLATPKADSVTARLGDNTSISGPDIKSVLEQIKIELETLNETERERLRETIEIQYSSLTG
jgi:TP901 family phage tail tape measure protein